MTASRDPERMIHAFLLEGAERMHDQVYDAIRTEVDLRPQRAVIGPWRVPALNKLLPIGLGAAAVIAALFLGTRLLGSPSGPGASAEPTASPGPTATLEPTTSPAAPTPTPLSAPPLTQAFTSSVHGFSVLYPERWTARAATQPWTAGTSLFPFNDPQARADFLYDKTVEDSLFLAFGSQPIGDSTLEDWIVKTGAEAEHCPPTEPITVGGASGRIGSVGECHLALVTTDGRGYWISLYRGDVDPSTFAAYDRAWFEEVLATVQLHPEDAVD
jgi:hypothetical protein